MKIIDIVSQKNIRQARKLALIYLKKGKIIAYPTDTVYGLGGDATRVEVIKKIFKIKGRGKKPLSIIVSSITMTKKYAFVPDAKLVYLRKFFPGPYTLILPQKKNLPKELTLNFPGIGIRIPKNKFIIQLVGKLGRPIITTSANLSGQPALKSGQEIYQAFRYKKNKPDLILDAGLCGSGKASKIIDLIGDRPKKIKR